MAVLISAATEPVAGSSAGGARPARVGVGRDEAGAPVDQPDRPGDRLERVGARLAEHDVVGVAVAHDVADVVHRGRQAGLADDVGRAARALVGEEVGRGQGRGPDRLLGHVDPAAQQPGAQVAGRVDRVVGEHEERAAGRLERLDELGRPAIGSSSCTRTPSMSVSQVSIRAGWWSCAPLWRGPRTLPGMPSASSPQWPHLLPGPARRPGDVPVILGLVRELAEYEKALHEVDASRGAPARRAVPGRA